MKLAKTTWIALVATALSLILGIAGYFLLPDSLAMQIGASGQLQNYMPKVPALLLPVAVGAVGTVLTRSGEKKAAGLILAVISPVLAAITFVMNWPK